MRPSTGQNRPPRREETSNRREETSNSSGGKNSRDSSSKKKSSPPRKIPENVAERKVKEGIKSIESFMMQLKKKTPQK